MIKYLGSKRLLTGEILTAVQRHATATTVLDLFSGTSRVGHALKADGYRVFANDHNLYAATLARCYVAADAERWAEPARAVLDELMQIEGEADWFTRTFCVNARYFQPKNGARIEAIRREIARRAFEPELEAILLTSLMEAADRVDSTCGVQMAYLKAWAARANKDLELRLPKLLPQAAGGAGEAHQLEAMDAVSTLSADVAYIDPPYNQHSYLGNYHVWETLCAFDEPEVYGVANKRVDVRTRKSAFNSKRKFMAAFTELIDRVDAALLVISFSDEGYLEREEAVALLSTRGEVDVYERDYKRYVGAQIGVHNPAGEKVGRVSHLRNKERIFVVKTPALRRKAV